MSTLIENGYKIFTDKEGNPIEEGYIFIGVAGLNPITNPLTSYWDAARTIPATNIRTAGGYPMYNGSPSRLYVEDNYSILVQNKNLQTVYVQLDAEGYVDAPSVVLGLDNTYVEVKSAATITVKAGSIADVNGTSVEIITDTDLQVTLADTDYYIRLTETGTLSMSTSAGTFDVDQNARYLSGDRILKWVASRDATEVTLKTMYDTYNNSEVFPMDQGVRTIDYPEFASMVKFDYIIDSDDKLNALVGITGGSYVNILVRAGTWTLSDSTYTLNLDDIGCYHFIGEPGATISRVSGSASVVGYSTKPSRADYYKYYMANINVAISSNTAIFNAVNVHNCYAYRFSMCSNVYDCNGSIFTESDHLYRCDATIYMQQNNYMDDCHVVNKSSGGNGMYLCNYLTNCSISYSNVASMGASFNECNFLVNCIVTGTITSVAVSTIACYLSCTYVSQSGCNLTSAPSGWYIFRSCTYVYAPITTNKGSASAFYGTTGVGAAFQSTL